MVGSRILVNKCQKGNPLLEKLQNVSWQFDDDLSVDYELGPTCGALFLSYEEAAVYLETLKAFETKPVDVLMGRQMDCELEQLIDTITQVKSINRTNAISMIKKYK
ncbi:MAG: ssDNA endonuclease and repair protein rad10, partial [Paramarteilia canceri]